MSASLIGRLRSSAFRLSPPQCRCRSRARASLRNRHQGPSIMGFEDEVEQSIGRPYRQRDGRSKQTCELTSSIVPRGTSFHRSVELKFPPIGSDPARLSCGCCGLFSGPAELGAINPDAVHDHGQPSGQRHDGLFHPAAPGDLHRPGLEPRPFLRVHRHRGRIAVEEFGIGVPKGHLVGAAYQRPCKPAPQLRTIAGRCCCSGSDRGD